MTMQEPGIPEPTERPVVVIVGQFDNRILVQCSWETPGQYDAVSRAMLTQLNQLGVLVVDDPKNYLLGTPIGPRQPINPIDEL